MYKFVSPSVPADRAAPLASLARRIVQTARARQIVARKETRTLRTAQTGQNREPPTEAEPTSLTLGSQTATGHRVITIFIIS